MCETFLWMKKSRILEWILNIKRRSVIVQHSTVYFFKTGKRYLLFARAQKIRWDKLTMKRNLMNAI